jgi:hypothetical protein
MIQSVSSEHDQIVKRLYEIKNSTIKSAVQSYQRSLLTAFPAEIQNLTVREFIIDFEGDLEKFRFLRFKSGNLTSIGPDKIEFRWHPIADESH